MIDLTISGSPTPWAPARLSRRGRFAYNPKHRDKEAAQWQIRQQYRGELLEGPVVLRFAFYMPIPESCSKKLRREILEGHINHTKKPDATNLQKFAEDCLKRIVIHDDSQVIEILSKKAYDNHPRTAIQVESLV